MANRAALFAAIALVTAGCTSLPSPFPPQRLALAWADEFDGDRLDTARWTADRDCWGGGNRERQCYTHSPANIVVADGKLRLIARSQAATGSARPEGQGPTVERAFTSARLSTRGKAAWRHGRIEVRAQLPPGQGLWPAIWMLPEAHEPGVSPLLGEIDIAEAVNLGAACSTCPSGREERVWSALHYRQGDRAREHRSTLPPADATMFQTYSVEWSPAAIVWRLNGEPYHRLEARAWRKASGGAFDQPYHLILNLAVGGAWPERVGAGGVDATALPAALVVDWVRVYQAPARWSRR